MKTNTRLALSILAGAVVIAAIAVIAVTQFGHSNVASTPAAKPTQMTRAPVLRGQAYGAWILTCNNKQPPQCALVMRALQQKTGRLVLSLAVTRGPKGNAVLVISTPPDVLIPAGVVIKPGNADPIKTGFQFCDHQRCEAIFLLDDNLQKALAAADQTGVRFTVPGNRPVGLKMPTKDFQAGYAAWNAKMPAPPPPPEAANQTQAPAHIPYKRRHH